MLHVYIEEYVVIVVRGINGGASLIIVDGNAETDETLLEVSHSLGTDRRC
jgi:hypothetical protein